MAQPRIVKRLVRGLARAGLALAVLLARGANDRPSTAIQVVGSDLLGAEFERAIQAFSAQATRPVILSLRGTRPGMTALASGEGDVGLFMLPPEENPPLGFIHFVVAYQVAVVAVRADSRLTEITHERLRTMAGTPARAGEPELVWATRGDLVWPLFERVILKGGSVKPDLKWITDDAVLLSSLRATPTALAIMGAHAAESPGVRVLALARSATETAYQPTLEAVSRGDYPLRLPLHVVCRREDVPRFRSLLRYLLSEETGRALARAHFVSVPVIVRDQRLLALEMME